MFRTLKISKTKTIAVITLVIVVLMVAMSCISNPTNQHADGDWAKGELIIRLKDEIRDEDFDSFVFSYKIYDLSKIEFLDEQKNEFHFSFNLSKIGIHEFIEILKNDIRVINAVQTPFQTDLIYGLLLKLHDSVNENFLIKFMFWFQDLELEIRAIHEPSNEILFLFNCHIDLLIDKYMEICNLSDVKYANIVIIGELLVTLNDFLQGRELDEFIHLYMKYEPIIRYSHVPTHLISFYFNRLLVDDFTLRELLLVDSNVNRVSFNFTHIIFPYVYLEKQVKYIEKNDFSEEGDK
ncbi:MAG: hypothetical protein FWG98_02780 [Candidatus Cloacimonetes bacterium]|nr:hypothetical protein [Candidatus Cloacimonadota bacterium]